MDYYPVNLNLKGKKAVVIGGGKIAERKLKGLLDASADVTIVSPKLTTTLTEYAQKGKVIWMKKNFDASDIQDAFLIIAATDQEKVNLAVKKAAAPHQLISLVDNQGESNFILPSVVNRGKLSITVSTSGASPILAKKIKQEIADHYGTNYQEYVDFLFFCRKTILKEIEDPKIKNKLLSVITEPGYLQSKNKQKDFIEQMNQLLHEDLN